MMIRMARCRGAGKYWNPWPWNLEWGIGFRRLENVAMDIFGRVSIWRNINVVSLIGLDGGARFVKRKGDIRIGKWYSN